jgi:hypothetical protein
MTGETARSTEGPGPEANGLKSHRDLIVWQKAMDLVIQVYRLTGSFPGDECYSFVAQLRLSAASVRAKIFNAGFASTNPGPRPKDAGVTAPMTSQSLSR